MRSEAPTLLSLSEFAVNMGLNPWFVAGYCTNVPKSPTVGNSNECDGYWHEYTYQANLLSRQDVANAIMDAEYTFADAIGFWPAPHYEELEEQRYPSYGGYFQPDGTLKAFKMRYGKLIRLGKQTRVVLHADVAAVLTDPLGLTVHLPNGTDSPVPDTFTVSTTVPTGTAPEEVELYFTETDRLDQPQRKWQIRPIQVEITGTAATITGRAWQLAPPALVLSTNASCMDALTDYVESVEVVRVVTDETNHGEFAWPRTPCAAPPCTEYTYSLCAEIEEQERSTLAPRPATWDTPNSQFKAGRPDNCNPPSKVRINYTSGVPRTADGEMDSDMASIISKLAASYLDCTSCACHCTKKRLEGWHLYEQANYETPSGKGSRAILPDKNSFGYRHGAAEAWRESRRYRRKIG